MGLLQLTGPRSLSATLALLCLAFVAGCGGVDRGSYVGSNEQLLDSLPVYPGAQKIGEDRSRGYPKPGQLFPENNSSGGYTTYREYSMPPSKRCSQIVDWYVQQLQDQDWTLDVAPENAIGLRKDSAVIAMDCGSGNIEVSADHHFLHSATTNP